MTEKEVLLAEFEAEYLPKVLGFCILRLNSHADAEDLSQEIALEVIKTIRRTESVENLNALVWSVSNHIFYKYLRRKKRSEYLYCTETLHDAEYTVEERIFRREEEMLLHREIARLSKNYRRAVIMHYFRGMEYKSIADALKTSPGTVKWWISEAKNEIKRGINIMRNYGEKSYNPGLLCVSCQGHLGLNGEPIVCTGRKSAQNILLSAYEKAVTFEELSDELGISMPYIEDEVEYLVENQLMKAEAGKKYRTDFVILRNSKMAEAIDCIYEECFPGYYGTLMKLLNEHKELLTSGKINRSGFAWERLLWVYIHFFTEMPLDIFRANIGCISSNDIQRPRGGSWIAIGYHDDHAENSYKCRYNISYDGPVMRADNAQSFYCNLNFSSSSVFFDLPQGVFNLCREIGLGEKSTDALSEDEQYLLSAAIEKRLFVRDGEGNLCINYFCTSDEGYQTLWQMREEFYAELKPYFEKAYAVAQDKLLCSVPSSVKRQAPNFISNTLNSFVAYSYSEGLKNGDICTPDKNNRYWLATFA